MKVAGIDLATTPLIPPPPGVVSNFIDPPDRTRTTLIATSIVLFISSTFVLLRCYTRLFLTRTFGISDYMFLLGYSLGVANTALIMDATRYGFGRRAWDVSLEMFFPNLARNLWGEKKTYALSLTFTKIAILLLYPPLNPNKKFRKAVYILIGIISVLSLIAFLLDVFLCWPVPKYWHFAPDVPACDPQISYIAFTGAMNISTDLVILIFPILILRSIVLPSKQKVAVGLILATGSFASLISLIRMIISFKVSELKDPTYALADLVLWSHAEVNAGVICAALPTLRPLVRQFFPNLLPNSSTDEASATKGVVVMNGNGHMTRYELKSFQRIKGGNKVDKVEHIHESENASEEHILSESGGATPWDGSVEKGKI